MRGKVLLILTLLVLSNAPMQTASPRLEESRHASLRKDSLHTSDETIVISSQSDLESWSSSGDGSSENPYMIEGISMTGVTPALVVANTSSHFILRNSVFIGSGSYDTTLLEFSFAVNYHEANIIFDNVTNGMIEDCFTSNALVGIALHASEACIVINSSVIASGCGILLDKSAFCAVYNTTIADSFYGIGLQRTSCASVEDNALVNCTKSAVYLSHATNCSIIRNTMTNSGIEFARSDASTFQHFHHQIEANYVGEREILYLRADSDRVLNCSDYAQAIIVSSENITLTGGAFRDVSTAVFFAFSPRSRVTQTDISHTDSGIWIYKSDNSRVVDATMTSCSTCIEVTASDSFTATANQFSICNQGFLLNDAPSAEVSSNILYLVRGQLRASGVWAYNSPGLVVEDNLIHLHSQQLNDKTNPEALGRQSQLIGGTDPEDVTLFPKLTPVPHYASGIATHDMNQISIRHNNISGFSYGVHMFQCDISVIVYNRFENMTLSCVTLLSCAGNSIYGNFFSAVGPLLAEDYGVGNTWYDPATVGNHWSNYGGWGPYVVSGNASSMDWYPNGQNAIIHVWIAAVVILAIGLLLVSFPVRAAIRKKSM